MKKLVIVFLSGLFLLVPVVEAETGVARSAFTSAIEDKEPVSELKTVSTEVRRVYFFTELSGLNGHAITHRWEYNGEVLAEIHFQVGAERWRTWSSKNMLASWTGTWRVSVLDEGGNIIEQNSFEYAAPEVEVETLNDAVKVKVNTEVKAETQVTRTQ